MKQESTSETENVDKKKRGEPTSSISYPSNYAIGYLQLHFPHFRIHGNFDSLLYVYSQAPRTKSLTSF